MIVLFDAAATAFTGHGKRIIAPTYGEVAEAINGDYQLRLDVPATDAALISVGDIIRCSTHRGDQPFRVYRLEKSITRVYRVYARHLSYDLLGELIDNRAPTDTTAALALATALQGTSFSGASDVPGANSARWVRLNPIAAIVGEDNSIIAKWGGEIERDGYTINVLQRLGADRGVQIRYAKNLTGLETSEDVSGVVTRIFPTGLKADGETVLALPAVAGSGYSLGYVDSARINDYPQIYGKAVHYQDIKSGTDEYPTEADAIDALTAAAQAEFAAGIDLPAVTLDVNFVDLSQTIEYADYAVLERVYLGDTVRCYHPGLGVDVSLRVASVAWDPLRDRYKGITLGQQQASITDVINQQANAIPALEVQQTALSAAVASATALINGAGTSYVRFSPSVANPAEIYVMDAEDAAQAENVIRINANGIGVSSTGVNGAYATAVTGAGIVANAITAGVLDASLIKTGTLQSADEKITIQMVEGSLAMAGASVSIVTEALAIDIVDGDDTSVSKVAIDANGVSAERVNADVLHAGLIYLDNTAPAIPGNRAMRLPPGTYNIPVYPTQPTGSADWDNGVTSIQQALDMLPKWLDGATVNIILHGQEVYGTVKIDGFWGNGSITIQTRADYWPYAWRAATSHVEVVNCAVPVQLRQLTTGQVYARNAPDVTVRECACLFSGGAALLAETGGQIYAISSEATGSNCLRALYTGCIYGNDVKGDGSAYAAYADYGGTIKMIGLRPYGSTYKRYLSTISEESTTQTHGSGYTPPAPTQTTVQIAVSTSRSRRGTQWYGDGSDTTVGYGQFESSGQWYGCMTFAGLSALAGKTVLSARLQYTRRNGVGSSSAEAIIVYSYSAPATLPTASWATGSAVTLVGNGKATAGVPRGVATWLDVNASDVQAIINGTAVGLALYTGSTGYGKGDGAGAANAPILEVTYQ